MKWNGQSPKPRLIESNVRDGYLCSNLDKLKYPPSFAWVGDGNHAHDLARKLQGGEIGRKQSLSLLEPVKNIYKKKERVVESKGAKKTDCLEQDCICWKTPKLRRWKGNK